ncbi:MULTISPECIES: metal ABC transporter permease [unclassified Halomonas]|uniref:metal ABC transporter permease n=1 Tax=unclassified Halomonas TaxID=2609666 RepID=UPI001EF4700F|nr:MULTISPECIES: metal ABC transporter permease [unclassified Halomonas]MCG7575711.1 metal ABC transporter permease [Halomonas sp. MMH1-48]MCG7602773.1 metal ABC transporter permease [Halomonas sp. MM17-34]MCG7612188.1 metal ABC transporter permease [Halomonas sp. MM17-29]MCG7619069.1 metal ABC transporter permease [Halomonas sp. DSH1-27]
MLDDFMWRAMLAGILVAMAAAPLGCFVVWRRMAYFGDATAHAAILGVALALLMNISIFLGVLAVALLMATSVSLLSGRGYAMDTLLGVMAHSALAIGLVAVSFLSGVRIDLHAYLFGDILAVGKQDLWVIGGGVALVLLLLCWRWPFLLAATLSEELAYACGLQPRREQLVLTLALALVVAVALKVVGVLLIAALLIIPAATARPFCRTPETMALLAMGVAMLSVAGGLKSAYLLDTPTGPTIVSLAALLFMLSTLISQGWRFVRQRFALEPERFPMR